MRVRPKNPAAVIRDPKTKRQLPAEGGEVPDSQFWHRRLRDGDVVLVASAPPDQVPPTPLTTRGGDR